LLSLDSNPSDPTLLILSRSKHLGNAQFGINSFEGTACCGEDFKILLRKISLQQFVAGVQNIQLSRGAYNSQLGTVSNTNATIAAAVATSPQEEAHIIQLLSNNDTATLYKQFENQVNIYEMEYFSPTKQLGLPFFTFSAIAWDYGYVIVDKTGHLVKMGMATDTD